MIQNSLHFFICF